MFRLNDLKRAIWTFIIIFIISVPSMSLAQVPKEAEIHNRLGNEYCDSGEFKKAVKEYEEAIKIYPDYTDAYYNVGITYYHDLKDYQKAVNNFARFLELEPDSPDGKQIQNWMATIERKEGIKPQPVPLEKKIEPAKTVVTPTPLPKAPTPPPLPEEPIKEVVPATPIPTTPQPPFPEIPTKAVVTPSVPPVTIPPTPYPDITKPEKGPTMPPMEVKDSNEEKYKKALAHKNRGNLYSSEGKHQMAIREYTKAIELKPDYTDALYNIAKTYDFDLNDNEQAIKYYEDFLKYEPRNSRDARQVQTWLTKANMDLANSKKKPPEKMIPETVTEKPKVPKVRAKYETEPFTRGLLEEPLQVASIAKKPSVPEITKPIAPPVPVAIPAPEPSLPPLAPAMESAVLKSYIPEELKSVQYSIILRAEMRNELMDIFTSKKASQPDRLAQLFLTKIKHETIKDGYEIAQIEIPGILLANIEKVYILSHSDRIRLNNEKGTLLRSPQTVQSKKRLQEINQILEDGYEIKHR